MLEQHQVAEEVRVSKNQIDILRHCLGLNMRDKPYRNYFVADEGHEDWGDLVALEQLGLMERQPPNPNSEFAVFCVTDSGFSFLSVHP